MRPPFFFRPGGGVPVLQPRIFAVTRLPRELESVKGISHSLSSEVFLALPSKFPCGFRGPSLRSGTQPRKPVTRVTGQNFICQSLCVFSGPYKSGVETDPVQFKRGFKRGKFGHF